MKIVLKFSLPARRHMYRGGRRMLRGLGRDLAALTTWSAVDTDLHGEMADIFNRTPRVRKFEHYLPIYESLVDRTESIRMLTIGSFYENSLQMWQEYLHRDSIIVSADVNSHLLKVAEPGGIYVRICDQQNGSLLSQVAAEFGPFDIILDEGSHTSSHMVQSFRCLFLAALTERGVYVVEDVNCDYWKHYRDKRLSFIDFVRALIDAMHAQYQVASNESNFRVGHPDRLREVPVPAITPVLGCIEVYDSIVAVRRTDRPLARTIGRS